MDQCSECVGTNALRGHGKKQLVPVSEMLTCSFSPNLVIKNGTAFGFGLKFRYFQIFFMDQMFNNLIKKIIKLIHNKK